VVAMGTKSWPTHSLISLYEIFELVSVVTSYVSYNINFPTTFLCTFNEAKRKINLSSFTSIPGCKHLSNI
jgi:hypothetical protein